MKSWSFYDLASGSLLDVVFTGPEEYLEMNTPEGAASVEGCFLSSTHERDASTGQIRPRTVPPQPLPDEILAESARAQRTRLLAECDWTQMPDADLEPGPQAAWRTYRRELRRITEQPNFPASIVWPQPPET